MRNLKLAFRTLFKTPFVTIVAIVSLALGIGANAAIFSCFNQMLLEALPVPTPAPVADPQPIATQTAMPEPATTMPASVTATAPPTAPPIGETVLPRNARGGGDRHVTVNVNVTGATGNAEVRSMVQAGVADGLRTANLALPDKIQRTTRAPRYRGSR